MEITTKIKKYDRFQSIKSLDRTGFEFDISYKEIFLDLASEIRIWNIQTYDILKFEYNRIKFNVSSR